jgi:hypothetical protein
MCGGGSKTTPGPALPSPGPPTGALLGRRWRLGDLSAGEELRGTSCVADGSDRPPEAATPANAHTSAPRERSSAPDRYFARTPCSVLLRSLSAFDSSFSKPGRARLRSTQACGLPSSRPRWPLSFLWRRAMTGRRRRARLRPHGEPAGGPVPSRASERRAGVRADHSYVGHGQTLAFASDAWRSRSDPMPSSRPCSRAGG